MVTGVDHGTIIMIVETSFVAFIERVVIFSFNLQDNFFSDNCVECHGLIGLNRVPILDSARVNKTRTFAHSQDYNWQWVV
jgi:hypothetical protein